MPAKGRRIASRQAQLNRRKRRQNRPGEGLAGAHAGVVPPPVVEGPEAATDEVSETGVTGTTSTATAVAAPPRRTRPQPGVRSRSALNSAYNYVIPEMRRIFIMAGILTIVLIVLSIFL